MLWKQPANTRRVLQQPPGPSFLFSSPLLTRYTATYTFTKICRQTNSIRHYRASRNGPEKPSALRSASRPIVTDPTPSFRPTARCGDTVPAHPDHRAPLGQKGRAVSSVLIRPAARRESVTAALIAPGCVGCAAAVKVRRNRGGAVSSPSSQPSESTGRHQRASCSSRCSSERRIRPQSTATASSLRSFALVWLSFL